MQEARLRLALRSLEQGDLQSVKHGLERSLRAERRRQEEARS